MGQGHLGKLQLDTTLCEESGAATYNLEISLLPG